MGIEIQWPLVIFSLCAGIGASMLVLVGASQLTERGSSASTRAHACIVCLVLLAGGGVASLLHLASPQNVMAAVTNIFSFSGISLELILLIITFIVALAYTVALKKRMSQAVLKVLAVLGMVFGLLLAFFCGHGYVMESRPLWNTILLPLAYLGTALAGGSFLFLIVKRATKDDCADDAFLRGYTLATAAACALSCFGYGFFLVANGGTGFGLAFWGGLVLCGIVGVLACGIAFFLKLSEPARSTVVVAGVVVTVLAALLVRVLMWETGEGYLELFQAAKAAFYIV